MEKLVPEYRSCYIDILAWGVRDLQGGVNPYVQFDLSGRSDSDMWTKQTTKSRIPNGKNANFLQRISGGVELPEVAMFAPQLSIKVFDSVLAGMSSELKGILSLDIEDKIPWSDNYVRPQADQFAEVSEDANDKVSLQR